jgi:SCP-2 sterol transfer family
MPDQKNDEHAENSSPVEISDEPSRLVMDPADEATASRSSSADGDDDEEIETWTNQPKGAVAEEGDSGEDDLLDEEEEHDAPPTRKVIQNGKDVLCDELPNRASRAKLRLKPHLTCVLAVELTSSGEKFVFDWKGDEPTVAPVSGALTVNAENPGEATVVDSIISLSEQNLMAVRSGDLNPQVAMLGDKIKVKGKVGPAVYLFNLIAPRFQQ